MFASNFFVFFHIALSLVAIGAGMMVLAGFLSNTRSRPIIDLFLIMSIATNITGLLFPFAQILPSHIVAMLSLLILAVSSYAYYVAPPARRWQQIFVGTAVAALYLNVFVLIAQTFLKNPALVALAPTQSELPFAVSQVGALVVFVWLGFLAVMRVPGQTMTVAAR